MTQASTTIVLVHGAMTDASVWHPVMVDMHRRGHKVLAPAIPMRRLAHDVRYLRAFLQTLEGPVLVTGHSYGGSIISDPAALTPNVTGLVFVAAFQQDAGETAGELNYRFPGSLLGPDTTALRPYQNGNDLYLRPECFSQVYAHDVNRDACAVMAAAQHPIDPEALNETFAGPAAWRNLPSWTLIATSDHSIPTPAQRFMAERAGSTVVEVDSSHAVPVAHPAATADLIDTAVRATR